MKNLEDKRTTLVHDRFQVCCAICGLVTTTQTKKEGISRAQRHKQGHLELVRVEVWDAMAKDKKKDIVWTNIPEGK